MSERRRRPWWEQLLDEELFPLQLLVIALVAAAAIGGYYGTRPKPETPPPVVTVPATEADVRKAMEDAEVLLPDITIDEQHDPIIKANPNDRPLTFLIKTKTNEYVFDAEHYKLRETDLALASSVGADQLARALDRSYTTGNPFPEEIRIAMTASVTAGPVTVSGTLDGTVKSLLELLGILDKVARLDIARIDIGIKGFADGEKRPDWDPPDLLSAEYTSFPVLHVVDESRDLWRYYVPTERQRVIPARYTNEDLPDLRAQYLRRELVEQVVHESPNKTRCKIYVLHNRALREPGQEVWRKAEVWVMVYLKRPT